VRRFNDWLQEHQTFVAIAGPVGVALSALGLRFAADPLAIGTCLLLLGLFAAVPSIAAQMNRLLQGRRATERCVKRLLQACAHSFGYPTMHVRTNIMRFSPDRSRRRVDPDTAFNMDNDPDRDLEIDASAGVSGLAALNRRPAFGDISLPLRAGGPDWGLRESEKAKVRKGLTSILSVPVFNPSELDGPLLATLQIDSDVSLPEIGFDSEPKWQMAERFADVLSLLLEAGR
jgi:hypothetical protein